MAKQIPQLLDDKSYASHEKEIQEYWDSISIYSKIKSKSQSNPVFKFMDGPPFVSGSLHYGHLAVGSYKSSICNAMTMLGYNSSYILGYDCHGLPIESKICSEYNLDSDAVKSMGITKFNQLCDSMITQVSDSWTPLFKKFGRLADFEDVYMTRDLNFMESCMWVFKQMWLKDLIYSGNKVMPYSYALETPLSNFEAGQNYQTITTKSIYVKFKLNEFEDYKDYREVYIVAWTTTPWTLVSNLALCVNSNIDYVLTSSNMGNLIMSEGSMVGFFGKKAVRDVQIVSKFKGSMLKGLKYEPIYLYFKDLNPKFHQILVDPYVKDDAKQTNIGTGIVHLAPAFGEDDFRVCEFNGLVDNVTIQDYCPIDSKCRFESIISQYSGQIVFEASDKIRLELKAKNILLKTQEYSHSYPHCYRTDTPLIYRTVKSIFVKIEPLKIRMLELNSTINWNPSDVSNRFELWLQNSKDWALSRFRNYGTPIPLWMSEDYDILCVGSILELSELSGIPIDQITNLHPEHLNQIKIVKSNKTYTRIPDIFDCWFESGCVPFGQIHYPFNEDSKAELDSREYLSDFVCEGLDQIRGWFYTLLVVSTAISDKAPFKNVVCTGMVMDENGLKLSKKLKNYADPIHILNEFGADFIRIYFIRSNLMKAEPLNFSISDIQTLKSKLIPYINSFKYLIEHITHLQSKQIPITFNSINLESLKTQNFMDKWLINRTIYITLKSIEYMKSYNMGQTVDLLIESIEELTNWYIKLNRDRLKGSSGIVDQVSSLQTLYSVLFTYNQLWAPFTPFLSEYLFLKLKVVNLEFESIESIESFESIESILLTDMPRFEDLEIDSDTLTLMGDMQRICNMVRNIRSKSSSHSTQLIKIKQCTISHSNLEYLDKLKSVIKCIQSELNVIDFKFEPLESNIEIKIRFNERELGQTFKAQKNTVKHLIESIDQINLLKLYKSASNEIDLDLDLNLEYPSKFFELYVAPINTADVSSIIDVDLLVKADLTYDNHINYLYRIRQMHSTIQTSRKEMGLHPWNPVTIVIDNKFTQFGDVLLDLKKSITDPEARFMVSEFPIQDIMGQKMGITKTKSSVMCLKKFEWGNLDNSIVEGYICLHHDLARSSA